MSKEELDKKLKDIDDMFYPYSDPDWSIPDVFIYADQSKPVEKCPV